MAYFTIDIAPDLDRSETERAVAAGPTGARTLDHRRVLSDIGFREIRVEDYGDEFIATMRSWAKARDARSAALKIAWGEDVFEERRQSLSLAIPAAEEGLLLRTLVVAVR